MHLSTIALIVSVAAAALSPFDGTWILRRCHTTPRGLHSEGTDTLVINIQGKSTELFDQRVTMRAPDGRPLTRSVRIVQRRHSLSTKVEGGMLTIRWSALQLIRDRSDSIPSGLHIAVGPCTGKYSIRHGKLTATFDTDADVFTREK